MVESKWIGGSGDDKSGVAIFVVDGEETRVWFDKFANYYAVQRLMEINFELGKSQGARAALAEINRVMHKHFID